VHLHRNRGVNTQADDWIGWFARRRWLSYPGPVSTSDSIVIFINDPTDYVFRQQLAFPLVFDTDKLIMTAASRKPAPG